MVPLCSTSAALIKHFLHTKNAQRALFLVGRLELEDQAWKAFTKLLAKDYKAVIYKDNRDDWRHAEIVVSTLQSLLFDKFQRLFSPTDFDLVISDEAHRSIGGNARAVFDYFIGYKLGLTATPKDDLLEEEFAKFLADVKPDEAEAIPALKTFFKAYATSESIRHIIEAKEFGDLAAHPAFSIAGFKAVPPKFRELVPQYTRDHVPVN